MLINFERSGLLEESLAIIRDKETQPAKFRSHLRKLGRYLVYEASKHFPLEESSVMTPLDTAETKRVQHDIVVISVLRAALPMVDSIFEEFDHASLGVVSASRGEQLDDEGREFNIEVDYMKIPDLTNKIVIIVDPMLATASTISFILGEVEKSEPRKIVLISAIAARYGIEKVEDKFPDVDIYTAAIDEILNDHGYIVPGLGDAGDRACNTPH